MNGSQVVARPKIDPLSIGTIQVHVKLSVIARGCIPGDNISLTAKLLRSAE